jgi:hypothetical protein
MAARLFFFAVAVFWLTMNALLWRAEFGSHGGDTPVPVELVWRKILTAPDASSLTVFQGGDRMGYCEFATSVGQEMSNMDADRPPPEGLAKRAGYQIHLAGNVAFGDFTNRVKFDGRFQFSSVREWQALDLKISAHDFTAEIHSLATNQAVHLKISSDGGVLERNLTFADLQNPGAVVRALTGGGSEFFSGLFDLPQLAASPAAQKLQWRANRVRVKLGGDSVPVYRLETEVLGRTVTVDVSTLGEILRVELPGGFSARIDEWGKP